jgi:hypothetical protein
MSDASPSPLPWSFNIVITRVPDAVGNILIWDAKGRLLFETQFYTPLHPMEDEANARLIVTAVNAHATLLAAAKEAAEILENFEGYGAARAGSIVGALQAAIAKAEEFVP